MRFVDPRVFNLVQCINMTSNEKPVYLGCIYVMMICKYVFFFHQGERAGIQILVLKSEACAMNSSPCLLPGCEAIASID